jgi:GT2 family glycosyltransferase
VVALVVGRDPGAWFDDTLASLAAQDHPAFSILVIDDASVEPLQRRVANIVPSAFVRRHEEAIGFARCANLVQEMVSGAGFYLFCHDDVALAPDAIRLLVAESLRSGASIVGPKLVNWLDHDRLLAIGLGLDRAGSAVSLIETGERDQGQHDIAQEVVALSGAAMLIRADAFHEIGGFDAASNAPEGVGLASAARKRRREFARVDSVSLGPDLGEDIDFCWRARIAGHAIAIEPLARVAHLSVVHGAEPSADALPSSDAESGATPPATMRRLVSLRERNRVRSMLTTSSAIRLPFIVPILLVQTIWRSLSAKHRAAGTASGIGPWRSVLRSGDLRSRRREVQASRIVADRDDLSRLLPIGARARAAFRADVSADSARLWNLAEHSTIAAQRANRVRLSLLVGGIFGWIVGSRSVIASGIPDIGQFMPVGSASDLFRSTSNGQMRPPAHVFLGLLKIITGPTVTSFALTIGMLVVGALTVWRMAAMLFRAEVQDFGTVQRRQLLRSPQTAVTVAYVLGGLGVNAIASGRIDGSVSYGLLPLVLTRILRAVDRCKDDATPTLVGRLTAVAPAAVVAAIMVAFAPGSLLSIVIIGSALVLTQTGPRRITGVVLGVLGAEIAILLLPWTGSLAARAFRWERLTGGDFTRSARLPFDVVLRLGTGRDRPSLFAWGLVAVAIVPLVVSSEFRLRRAVLGWTMALFSIAVTWASARGWLGPLVAHPSVALGPAAIGFAIAGGIGATVTSGDLRSQQFGWRQAVSILATSFFVLAALPLLGAAGNGRWMLPVRSIRSAVSWMASSETNLELAASATTTTVEPQPNQPATKGPAVWIGPASALPLAGWTLNNEAVGRGTAFAVAPEGLPSMSEQWLAPRTANDDRLEAALGEVSDGGTSRVGALIPELRYIVLAERIALDARRMGSTAALRAALRRQFDLREVESPQGLTIFENVAWNGFQSSEVSAPRAVVLAVLRVVQLLAWLTALSMLLRSRRRRRSRELLLLDQERSFDETDPQMPDRVGDFMSTSFADDPDDSDGLQGFEGMGFDGLGLDDDATKRPVRRTQTRRKAATEDVSDVPRTASGTLPGPELGESGLADELWERWTERQDRRRKTTEPDESAGLSPGSERRKRDADAEQRRKR